MTYTIAECTANKLLMRAEELPETCRVSCRSKFGKLVHLVGFIIKKFVTMHGHMNVKFKITLLIVYLLCHSSRTICIYIHKKPYTSLMTINCKGRNNNY